MLRHGRQDLGSGELENHLDISTAVAYSIVVLIPGL